MLWVPFDKKRSLVCDLATEPRFCRMHGGSDHEMRLVNDYGPKANFGISRFTVFVRDPNTSPRNVLFQTPLLP